jgi:hypothetical protein
MDVHVEELRSTVRATDTAALLDPRLLERLVRMVAAEVRREEAHRRRAGAESRLDASSTEAERFGDRP